MATGSLPLPEAIWPPRVLLVESDGLRRGGVRADARDRSLDLGWVADPYLALLMLGCGPWPSALVLPTDLVPDPVPVLESVRSWCSVPVLLAMTADPGAGDVAARAVEAGCSGLLSVPFGETTLSQVVGRQSAGEWSRPVGVIEVAGVIIDPSGLTVSAPDGTRAQLSGMQFACLHYLAQCWPAVVRLPELADHLGLDGTHPAERTRRLIARLRHHLEPLGPAGDVIQNVRGVGYRLRP